MQGADAANGRLTKTSILVAAKRGVFRWLKQSNRANVHKIVDCSANDESKGA